MFRIIFFTIAGFIAGYYLDRYLSDRHRGVGSEQHGYPASEPEKTEKPTPLEPAVDQAIPTSPFNEAIPEKKDDLTAIKGIGPTFAKRLEEAGIVSFQQLMKAAPADLKQITRIRDWQRPGVDDWIEEAGERNSS